jgi:hypothetical protein
VSLSKARPADTAGQALQDLLRFLAKGLVDTPEAVEVTQTTDGQTVVLRLRVAQGEVGRVIGKDGRVAKALRTVLRAAASRRGARVLVDIEA